MAMVVEEKGVLHERPKRRCSLPSLPFQTDVPDTGTPLDHFLYPTGDRLRRESTAEGQHRVTGEPSTP